MACGVPRTSRALVVGICHRDTPSTVRPAHDSSPNFGHVTLSRYGRVQSIFDADFSCLSLLSRMSQCRGAGYLYSVPDPIPPSTSWQPCLQEGYGGILTGCTCTLHTPYAVHTLTFVSCRVQLGSHGSLLLAPRLRRTSDGPADLIRT